jgi:CDP-paratose 2-epimerase
VVIFASTNKVYGDLGKNKIFPPAGIDETEQLDFIFPYGCSKGATDLYFQDYARIYGLKTIVFRNLHLWTIPNRR